MANEVVFIDTSGFYALMDRSDRFHPEAGVLWQMLLDDNRALATSNFF